MMAADQTWNCWICGGLTGPAVTAPVAGLLECESCGFWFRPLTQEDVSTNHDDSYFEGYAGVGYVEHSAGREYEANQRLKWLAGSGASSPGRLLEIGSAAGQFVAAAAAAGWQAKGIEGNNTVAEYARSVLAVDVSTGLIEDQDLPEASFDLVVMWHVLEHIPEPLATVRRLVATLKPGGRFAVEVPNAASREAHAMGADWPPTYDPNHVSQFTPASMRRLLVNAGLDVEQLDTVPFRHYTPRRSTQLLWWLASIRRERAVAFGPHPSAHPLLRACARRPDGGDG
jgi:SAM-dependent methyltransferase